VTWCLGGTVWLTALLLSLPLQCCCCASPFRQHLAPHARFCLPPLLPHQAAPSHCSTLPPAWRLLRISCASFLPASLPYIPSSLSPLFLHYWHAAFTLEGRQEEEGGELSIETALPLGSEDLRMLTL